MTNLRIAGVALGLLLGGPALCGEAPVLAGTTALDPGTDWRRTTLRQLHDFLDRQIQLASHARERFWNRDFTSAERFARSIEPNRVRLRERIGAVDPRVAFRDLRLVGTLDRPALRARTERYEVFSVAWPVLNGMTAEGLLVRPRGPIRAAAVVITDADQTPESLVGLRPGEAAGAQFVRRLAEQGVMILCPVLIDRRDKWSGDERLERYSDQSHREWIYRQAAVVGRHIIGYEVQKVFAAVDWLERQAEGRPVGVAGYGEGGAIGVLAAALDARIDVAWVSGYFGPREELWKEPLYRNIWRYLEEFGDAEIAAMLAHRALILEYSRAPEITHPGVPTHKGATRDRLTSAGVGRLTTPPWDAARREWERALAIVPANSRSAWTWVDDGSRGPTTFGSAEATARFTAALGISSVGAGPSMDFITSSSITEEEVDDRQFRQFWEMQEFTQKLGRWSEYRRNEFFWDKLEAIRSPEEWTRRTVGLHEYFADEFIGRIPIEPGIGNPRTRLLPEFENPRWSAYEVVLDVWPGVNTWGYLLLPKDLKPGERRPVVVCQHGAAGNPSNVVSRLGMPDYSVALRGVGAALADRGFVVLAPFNPNAIMGQEFFALQRKANPLGKSLFSLITANHERFLGWLQAQPFVDPGRIAFYGLSYGGKTAMRVPAILPGYCLSICSGDWNNYVPKMMSVRRDKNSFMFTPQHETIEFNLANTFSYAEMAALIAPRPFMVENGYRDIVMPVEWAAGEYAKVKKLYYYLGIPERTDMDYFDGPHEIHGEATFRFLHHHLRWPELAR
jgi:dienelactone hydrolase